MKLFRPNRSVGVLAVLGTIFAAAAATAVLIAFSSLILSLSAMLGASLANAAQPAARAPCDWSAPGAARYTGTTAQAVENYLDMPPKARAEIRAKLDARPRRFDAVATITRDAITSGPDSYTGLRDMHWRGGLCRGPVSRAGWAPKASESGLVYCSGDHCIIVPAVCGNVARVDRVQRAADSGGVGRVGLIAAPGAVTALPGAAPAPGPEPEAADTFAALSGSSAHLDALPGPAASADPPDKLAPAPETRDRDPGTHWPQQPGWSVIGGGGPCAACVPCPVVAVPEPETWAVFGAGLLALGFRSRRRCARP